MRNLKIKRLDHHGIVAGVIDDLKIVEIVNQWVGVDEQEPVSSGMIIKSMILNGLGFSSRPLTLTVVLEYRHGTSVRSRHHPRSLQSAPDWPCLGYDF